MSPKHPKDTLVIVAMSGGVDSSVTALLLLQQGYRVEGMFMKNWEEDDTDSFCSASEDIKDVEAVCEKLNIKLHKVNFAAEYWDHVFEHFLEEYRCGRTPNPDIWCNKEIKFKAFLDYAKLKGADFIATGHYARVEFANGFYQMRMGCDPSKDQTYFLYTLNQQQLANTLFPVGELQKSRVRQLAKDHHLITHNKKDSTGICFIGERRFKTFLEQYLKPNPGLIKTADGQAVGRHDGLMYYTLGQRQGLGIGGLKTASDQPWYVLDKEIVSNTLIVGQGHDHPLLYKNTLTASQLQWVNGEIPSINTVLTAKVRYRNTDEACKITTVVDDAISVSFAKPQFAITPGQSIVFYDRDICLGGGIIDSAYNQD